MEQNSIQIQIEEDFPDTHYFLYKGKKYPFKFDFFKNSSKYFSTNLSRFEQIEVIPLIDDESGECANIDEDSIDTFIQYVQRQKVTLNNDNVCTLNYLANKFEVPQLINVTKNYISVHQSELVLTILISNQNDSNFVTDVYETIVSENLPKCIDDEHLLMINIPIIYRILKMFSVSSKKEEKNSLKINEFLFKMLDKNGIKASPLFEFADFGLLPNEKFNLLLTKYSNDFDFHFINKNCFQKLYETQSKIIENDIKTRQIQKQQENDILLIKNELSRLQSERLIEKKERKQKDEVIESMKNEISRLNEEINKMKIEQTRKIIEENQKIIKDINLIKQKTDEITQKKYEEQINEVKNNIKNIVYSFLFKKDHNIELFNKIDGEKQKSLINELKLIANDELINKTENLLVYLSNEVLKSKKETKELNYIFINKELDEEDNIIGINYYITKILYINKSLSTTEFNKQINNFSQLIIEIKYPSKHFKEIYENVLKLKCSHQCILKIRIFITKIQSTDQNFHLNKNIDYVKLDSCVTKIESKGQNGSFEGCKSLTQIIIPPTLKSIGNCAFWECNSLKQISIPSSITSIEEDSFGHCISLRKIAIPSSITEIQGGIFKKCISLAEITIPSSVKVIRNNSFMGCSSLKHVFFITPSSLTLIESNAFTNCTSLTRIIIPFSVTTIEKNAFSGCTSLLEINIPSSINSVILGLDPKVSIIRKND